MKNKIKQSALFKTTTSECGLLATVKAQALGQLVGEYFGAW